MLLKLWNIFAVRLAATLWLSGMMAWLGEQRAGADDWWQFRGPQGQGHSDQTGLPLRWSPDTNVVWRTALAGEGWSSPVYHDGRLYLTAAIPVSSDGAEGFRLAAICLDAHSGRPVWEKEVFREVTCSPRIHAKNSHASPTPLVSGQRLYVHFGHEGTACLDLSGEVLWRNDQLRYPPVHGNGGSPVLVDDRLIFSCDGGSDPFVAALDAADGQLRWKQPRDTAAVKKFSFSTPLVIEVQGKRQVISPGSDLVAAYEPLTGREIWRAGYQGYSVIPRPVYTHGLVFLATGYDAPSVIAVRPNGTGDVSETHRVWTVTRGAPHTPSLLVVGDELYMVSDRGIASCLDARTGEVHWQERLDGGFSASPLYADGRIYVQNEDGVGYVLAPGKSFRLLARNDLQERTLASYAVAEGALFIRTAGHLYRIDEPQP
jgi:outer membrane protein assembly factor BamB